MRSAEQTGFSESSNFEGNFAVAAVAMSIKTPLFVQRGLATEMKTPGVMKVDHPMEYVTTLTEVRADLDELARQSEKEIESVTHTFKGLAGQANTILKQAAGIVGCVEKEGVGTVLSKVQTLCMTVSDFLEKRLMAATTIIETLKSEEKLLGQLTGVTQRQEAIASHLKALSVLTNVEVAQLGSAGGDFEILAQELAEFSRSVTQQTQELAANTESHKQMIGETRRELTADIPRLRSDMTQIEDGIRQAMQVIETGMSQLASIPGQFRSCAEETSQQIAGVVAAIQSHDITRQQIEHVQQGLQLIESRIIAANGAYDEELPVAYAGLTIQSCQLKTIAQTVAAWTSQIKRCMGVIRQLSASDIVSIGPVVLNQERELSSQLGRLEQLQQKSQEYSGRIGQTLGGLSNLLELVNEHQERSQTIRHRLQLLTFNTLIEANSLGQRGAVVSAIANLTKAVSAEWNVIADQSRLALTGIKNLVKQNHEVMEVFSEANSQKLREEQSETRAALDIVRDAAAFVGREAAQMQIATDKMQAILTTSGHGEDQFQACFGNLDRALNEIEQITRKLESDESQMARRYDAAELERLFSAFYTTEIEREVLRAALHGTPLPVLQQTFMGNDVELF